MKVRKRDKTSEVRVISTAVVLKSQTNSSIIMFIKFSRVGVVGNSLKINL